MSVCQVMKVQYTHCANTSHYLSARNPTAQRLNYLFATVPSTIKRSISFVGSNRNAHRAIILFFRVDGINKLWVSNLCVCVCVKCSQSACRSVIDRILIKSEGIFGRRRQRRRRLVGPQPCFARLHLSSLDRQTLRSRSVDPASACERRRRRRVPASLRYRRSRPPKVVCS